MASDIILRSYLKEQQSCIIPFTTTAFLNATVASQVFNRSLLDWDNEQPDVLKAMYKYYGQEDGVAIDRSSCASYANGMWLHPPLAIIFASWLNSDFAVWCGIQIEQIRSTN